MFWRAFMKFWKDTTGFCFVLSELDIIFGILNPFNDDNIDVLNHCILFAKQYIYQCKRDEQHICVFEFLVRLKNRIDILCTVSMLQNKHEKFLKKWFSLYNRF